MQLFVLPEAISAAPVSLPRSPSPFARQYVGEFRASGCCEPTGVRVLPRRRWRHRRRHQGRVGEVGWPFDGCLVQTFRVCLGGAGFGEAGAIQHAGLDAPQPPAQRKWPAHQGLAARMDPRRPTKVLHSESSADRRLNTALEHFHVDAEEDDAVAHEAMEDEQSSS